MTTGSAADAVPGALNQADTQILFGDTVNPQGRSGVRLSGGLWLSDDHSLGLESSWFYLGKGANTFSAISPPENLVLARPFFNEVTQQDDVRLVALPGVLDGSIAASFTSRLAGTEADLESELLHCKGWRVAVLGGFRYLELSEAVNVADLTGAPTAIPGAAEPGEAVSDSFATRNYFYGGQIGGKGEFSSGQAFFDLLVKLAFGLNHEIVDIEGATFTPSAVGPPTVIPIGLLALPSNSGRFARDEFSMVPEFGLTLGYRLGDHLRASVGYSLLYWYDTVRPGQVIDIGINPAQLPPPQGSGQLSAPLRPPPPFQFVANRDFWAQGISLGLEVRW